ncbi:hypothetical protein AAA67_002908 [Salmonella enterica subsp. diarizonae]|nr:hypothetical protein [Salmonella enterica subsp. diarizonae]
MKRKNATLIIFVEGETELSLFKKMKRDGDIQVKKIVKKNLWNNLINSYTVNIPQNSILIIIFDTDNLTQKKRFIENIHFLLKRKHKVILLQQTPNFEEEIAYCCNLTSSKFISIFCKNKTARVADFKRNFISCSNPMDKLVSMGMDHQKWFKRDLHEVLDHLKAYKSDFVSCFPPMK